MQQQKHRDMPAAIVNSQWCFFPKSGIVSGDQKASVTSALVAKPGLVVLYSMS